MTVYYCIFMFEDLECWWIIGVSISVIRASSGRNTWLAPLICWVVKAFAHTACPWESWMAVGKKRTNFPVGRPQLPTLLAGGRGKKRWKLLCKIGQALFHLWYQALIRACFPLKLQGYREFKGGPSVWNSQRTVQAGCSPRKCELGAQGDNTVGRVGALTARAQFHRIKSGGRSSPHLRGFCIFCCCCLCICCF